MGTGLDHTISPTMRRIKISKPLMSLEFAARELQECRKAGYSVSPDATQRDRMETIIREIQWWLDYGEDQLEQRPRLPAKEKAA